MSIQLQALVHDYPSQLTAGKIFGTVVTKVHTPRPSVVSVRDGTDQPNDCFHSLECMERSCLQEKKLSCAGVSCTMLLSQSDLFHLLNPVSATISPAQSNSPSLACQNSQTELTITSKGVFVSTLGPKDPLSFITLFTSSIYSFNIPKNRSSHIHRFITF